MKKTMCQLKMISFLQKRETVEKLLINGVGRSNL